MHASSSSSTSHGKYLVFLVVATVLNQGYSFSFKARLSSLENKNKNNHHKIPTKKIIPSHTVLFHRNTNHQQPFSAWIQDDPNNNGGTSSSSSSSHSSSSSSRLSVASVHRGGDDGIGIRSGYSANSTAFWNAAASLWGAGGVIMILAKSIKRILPIALEPFSSSSSVPLSPFQFVSYIGMCIWFAYVEGYKGFQCKFSPLVVSRSLTLQPKKTMGDDDDNHPNEAAAATTKTTTTPIHHVILAPFYSMGLFHATKKRKIVSWSVSLGVALIVAGVKRLPYPWRNIVDAGVIVGLSWGSLSIGIGWVKAVLLGKGCDADPALPGN
mmetsp:Transcript_2852/g.4036  ORF Transcript_2852/g.4036 Transcript_2852/m.4036 type:complete len:325 (-) Transcript_2852:79-1053(-)|eukprot:CAMPEP_0184862828 /NCGR_PEP_ID=MMETSP0580-20130426/7991_1 /TAXON_ID=1118495 /ORGANISM="Dactyliosolen fragilissimus" /LENGTH=324 /DNA_ID=CAMNT_0027360833 /DNA_START=162 /DNA_END=1136 /DNA_ORIENTATION=+